MVSNTKARWFAALFLIAICVFVVLHFVDSLWSVADLPLHYALVARVSDHWTLPTNDDPSLEELNYYPRTSHRLAALMGKLVGSPLVGMQVVAMLSLAALWSGLGFIYYSLPQRPRWLALGILVALLLANRSFIQLELFGNEVLVNYFFPQLAGQAIAIVLLALVLWMEKAGISRALGILVLGLSAPILPQFHLLPGVELLATGTLLVAVTFFETRDEKRRLLLVFGLIVVLSSLAIMVVSPAFRTMVTLSANEGLLELKYARDLDSLAIECGIVIALSALLIWRWLGMASYEARVNGLALKYLGIFGMAVGVLCLLQILMFNLGFGSEYACKKYGFALNTVLILDIPVLLVALLSPSARLLRVPQAQSIGLPGAMLERTFVGVFVLVAVFAILPPRSARFISVAEVVRAERFAMQYREPTPGVNSGRYDLAIDLVGGHASFDFLISVGVLRAPRSGNAYDTAYLGLVSKPARLGRVFTRAGASPWDVEVCRQVVTPEGYAILDGQCVLGALAGSDESRPFWWR
jgi:hypothetical protein